MRKVILIVLLLVCTVAQAFADFGPELRFKDDFARRLVEAVPDILKGQDPKTGRFGTGVWIVGDQNVMFSLATAWAMNRQDNPYYHDPKVLQAVVAAGDALIADADANGQWVFRKKDGSTWGNTYMCWTYSAWIRSYALVRDGMAAEDRKRWDDALTLGFTGISRTQLGRVHNIPATQAASLYVAGQVLNRPEWCKQAKEFMARVVKEQDPEGYWSENYGPVILYGNYYSDALGVYYAASGDETVLPAIKKAISFYSTFTYPNGSAVETVDERNPYNAGLRFPNPAFTLTPEGRGYTIQQIGLLASRGSKIGSDHCANFLVRGHEGPAVPTAVQGGDRTFRLENGKAMVRRQGPWFICMSAYHCPIRESRWIEDRQNLVSIFHDKCGLILGGGNTKLQPLWSNFTVGDISLLRHKPGDEAPKFLPEGPLLHIPSAAGLGRTDTPTLGLVYGPEKCSISVEVVDGATSALESFEQEPPVCPECALRSVYRRAVPPLALRGTAPSIQRFASLRADGSDSSDLLTSRGTALRYNASRHSGQAAWTSARTTPDSVRIRVKATCKSGMPVAGHLTFIPHVGQPFRTGRTAERKLEKEGFMLTDEEAGGWIAHAGWKLTMPPGSSLTWPVLPHNPYRKDGRATPEEGRLVVTLPFSPEQGEYVLTLSVEE